MEFRRKSFYQTAMGVTMILLLWWLCMTGIEAVSNRSE